ncbi:MAG: phosphatase PAP2 family protein [Rhodanobacteraceae bacterium]
MLRIWHALTYLGDGAVLLPCTLLLLVWLIAAPTSRRTGWLWLVALMVVGGGVALSKVLYMVSGWHPAGWDFIGLSGHAALSFLFWPSAGALVTERKRTGLRAAMVALGVCLALAISASSWVLRDHSLSEVALGGLWGALVATAFLTLTWQQLTGAPRLREWMIAGVLLIVFIAFGHEFPSTRVLRCIASQVSGRAGIHTRRDLGPQAQLSEKEAGGLNKDLPTARPRTPP